MAEFFTEYGLFLLKVITLVVAVLMLVGGLVASREDKQKSKSGHIEARLLNDHIKEYRDNLRDAVLSEEQQKLLQKKHKAEAKAKHKKDKQTAKAEAKKVKSSDDAPDADEQRRKRVYVLDFDGDIKASDVELMREEITSVLTMAEPKDEVVVRLESGGGMVHSYGLASSQLQRIKQKGIPLTVCVDMVAASGGYMMACVADKILAAPFAVLGSIGVVAQLPNFHKVLKKHDVDYEMITAGEHKRTLTMFGENTDKGREKFREDIEDTHALFKDFVSENRPQIDIAEVANGDVWFGRRAMAHKLADELMTSDEYLGQCCENADVYEISYVEKVSLQERFGLAVQASLDKTLLKLWERVSLGRWY
ncbi:MAG: protease SohB [Gammaproteobacteria bacterium]|nr:MAG: protease SohB [Gammaproteobacteria bacterium]